MKTRMKAIAAAILALTLFLAPGADAGQSAKGYSTPKSSSSSGYAKPRPAAPSTSNGYSKPAPSVAAPPPAAPVVAPRAPLTGSDAALSRQAARSSLHDFTAQQERAKFARTAPPPAHVTPYFAGYRGRYRSYDDWYVARSSWYGGYGWSPPIYVYHSYPHFGMWDAMFLWFMLDSVSNASHAMWFHNHYDDPGYVDWRREADRLAADDADLKAKLADLDARTAALQNQPRDPNYMPPDAKPELALARENVVAPDAPAPAAPSGGHTLQYVLLGLGILGVGYILLRRGRVV